MSSPITNIVVLIAMDVEAAPLVAHLNLVKVEPSPLLGPIPAHVYRGAVDGCTVHVVTNGKCVGFSVDSVGTVPAALTAYAACAALSPDLIINAGTAGGFAAKGGVVGDVYLATEFKNHDRRIPIPGFDAYGIGATPATAAPAMAAALGLKTGIVSTGNSLDAPDVDKTSMAANDASVKEMEAAGIAHVARLFNTPMLAVKAITDIVDGPHATQDEFLANLAAAATSLQTTVPKVIAFAAGKLVTEL